jgi:hypothetical protein
MNINQLKTELREFIALSETIAVAPWTVDSANGVMEASNDVVCYPFGDKPMEKKLADFIARSRNISPTMAKMLLVTVEGLERLYDDTEGYADGAPDASGHDRLCNEVSHAAKHQLNKILKLWEETK